MNTWGFFGCNGNSERELLYLMPRDIFLVKQGCYYSLKWSRSGPNAGAISFRMLNFKGDCCVNSKAVYWGGGDRTLAEEIEHQGFKFDGNGFQAAPKGKNGKCGVKGHGSGCSYLGYRTFNNLNAATDYLKSVGIIVNL